MRTPKKSKVPGITVRFATQVRHLVVTVAKSEHRSAAAYIEELVERDLQQRQINERVIHIYTAADAPEWTGSVVQGQDETSEEHAERTSVLNALFAG